MKTMKKLLCMTLAILMVLSLSIPAFAEGEETTPTSDLATGKLEVHYNNKPEGINVYQMFTAAGKSGDGNIEDNASTVVTYTLNSKWNDFFWLPANESTTCPAGSVDLSAMQKANSNLDKSGLADLYIKALYNNSTSGRKDLIDFAQAALSYAQNKNISATASAGTVGPDTTIFENLAAGYYLVDIVGQKTGTTTNRGNDETGEGENDATAAMLVNVPSALSTNLWIKNEKPTVEKKVNKQDDASYDIGDEIPFTLTAAVPNHHDFKTYTFQFKDVLSKGLTFEGVTSITMTSGDTTKTLTAGVDYELTQTTDEEPGETTIIIDIKDVKSLPVGAEIVVSYKASLNENAVTGVDGNLNTASLIYSTDPDWVYNSDKPDDKEPTEESPKDTTTVYTFDILVNKYYAETTTDDDGGSGKTQIPLSGATFKLYKDAAPTTDNDNPIMLVKDNDTTYHVAKGDEVDDSGKSIAIDSFVTPASGQVTINGLGAGTYYLVETSAPFGYNKLEKSVEIKITYTVNGDGAASAIYTVDGQPVTDHIIGVENKKGAILPETGSFGTIGLTAVGVAVVFFGMNMGKKKEKQN